MDTQDELNAHVNRLFLELDIRKDNSGDLYYWPRHDNCCWPGLQQMTCTPEKLSPWVDRKGVCVQAGGNAGMYVVKYAKEFQRVYTFEPNPMNFFALCANTVAYPNVVKLQACVGNEHKMVQIEHQWDDYGGMHIFERPCPTSHMQKVEPTMLPIITIDNLGLDACDLIQLDLEGYEYYALLGAVNTIEKYKPVICIEQAWAPFHYGISLETVEQFLLDRGYTKVDSWDSDCVYKVL